MQLTKINHWKVKRKKEGNVTYRKALVFNPISSMCGRRWKGKRTEESVGKMLVVQESEGVPLPSSLRAVHVNA